jgi:hypothetical protein
MEIYSQRDPRWMEKGFPNVSNPGYVNIMNFGCLLCCLANFAQKRPDEIMDANQDMFVSTGPRKGSMATSELYGRYGFTIRAVPHTPGTPLPKSDKPYIAVTSYFKRLNPDWGTHFYIRRPDGTSIDPSSAYNPKTTDRYESTVFEIRYVESSNKTVSNKPELEKRVQNIEDKLGISY